MKVLEKSKETRKFVVEAMTLKEKKAVAAGRRAYAQGDWKPLDAVVHELGYSPHRTRAKKS